VIWVKPEQKYFCKGGWTAIGDLPVQAIRLMRLDKSSLSGDFQGRNFLDLLSEFLLRPMQIVPLLQIEPEIGTVSAQLPEP